MLDIAIRKKQAYLKWLLKPTTKVSVNYSEILSLQINGINNICAEIMLFPLFGSWLEIS
jgi:hypothetical protein